MAETHELFTWNDGHSTWLGVAQGSRTEMEEALPLRYAGARRHGIDGAAFCVVKIGHLPQGHPADMGVEIVRAESKPEPSGLGNGVVQINRWPEERVAIHLDGPRFELRSELGDPMLARLVKIHYEWLPAAGWSYSSAAVEGVYLHEGQPTALKLYRTLQPTEPAPVWLEDMVSGQRPDRSVRTDG